MGGVASVAHAQSGSGPAGLPLQFMQVDGFRLAYTDAGQGEPLLLLHGYPQDHRTWRHVAPALARTHRVIAVDWFGWGASERSTALEPAYWSEVDRLDRLRAALGLERFGLLAHDYGGFLALGYMSRYGRAVTRLAIINSRAQGAFTPGFYRQTALLSSLARTPVLRAAFRWLPIHAMHLRSLRFYVRRGCFDDALLEQYIGWMRTRAGREFFQHFYAHYDVTVRPELAAALPHIACPTAVIWGTRDPFCPVAIGEELAARIPEATLTRIEGADHFVMEERPDDVVRALQDLLARPGS